MLEPLGGSVRSDHQGTPRLLASFGLDRAFASHPRSMRYTRRTWVLRSWSASVVFQGKASRRVIGGSIAKSDNAALGHEERAPGRKIHL